MIPLKYKLSALLPIVLAGCSDDLLLRDIPDNVSGNRINIISSINQEYETRANDGGFADGDAIGVYVVAYDGTQPGNLAASGNHATNVKFNYSEADGSWRGAAQLYWPDAVTPVDAYGYYPFAEMIDDVNACRFKIEQHQDKESGSLPMSGYEASDFLWAKAERVVPGRTINLQHNHIMSSVEVELVKGEDFGDEWDMLVKRVTVDNTLLNSTIDLSKGMVTADASGERKPITPYRSDNRFRAIVAPQTVPAGEHLISITVGEEGYKYSRNTATVYQPGKLHRFTIRVDKKLSGDYSFTLIGESITDWINDEVSHNASAKVYTVIHCPEPGALESAVKAAGINPQNVDNLKLTGTMNMEDFNYFKHNFNSLISLNLKDLRTKDIVIGNWTIGTEAGWGIKPDGEREDRFDDALPEHMLCEGFNGGNNPTIFPLLHYLLLPDNCKYIGDAAFAYVPLTGTLTIPEGVKWIGSGCIGAYGPEVHHISTLNIPSTVEHIGREAFTGCEFTNELILPDGLKYIGEYAFSNCRNTYGQARIPSGIKYLGNSAFNDVPLTGTVVFPAGMKVIPNSFSGTKITGIYIPEGAEEIAESAFGGELRGDIHLPNSIKKIGRGAFAGSKISHINIPTSLEVIPRDMLNGCKYLVDSIVIPNNIRRIDMGAFLNCANLKFIHIPASVEIIGGDDGEYNWLITSTFSGCYSLEELRCDAVIPPTIENDAFSDLSSQVHKDNFTLVVPRESVKEYQSAQYWREFKRISEYRNLVFRPQIAKVLNKGGSREVVLNVDAGKRWSVTESPSWLHISAGSGTGKSTLTITIDALAHGSDDREGEIKVKIEGTDYETSFKVSQFDYEYDEDQSFVMQTHSIGKGVDLVIIGDGYDAEDIATGNYINDMQKAAEMYFDLEPFKTYRGYFNVYTAFAMSHESGIGSVNYLRNSKFSTSYGNGSHDSRISCAADAVTFYCLDNTPVSNDDFGNMTCMLVANGTQYDGVTVMYDNGTAVAICPKSDAPYPNDWRGVIQHEACGHGFTKLADEYVYHLQAVDKCKCVCCQHASGLLAMHAKGEGKNLSLSPNTEKLPWKHMLSDYRVNDVVDVWEGGHYHKWGVYRSEYNSVMNNNIPYMSTWCRELAVRRIMKIAGVPYDYEQFIAKDSRDWGRDFTVGTRAPAATPMPEVSKKGCEPIRVKGAPQRRFKGVRKANRNHNH